MTKRRRPLSIHRAIERVAKLLPDGYAEAAEAAECSESMARAWGDPDRREEIPVARAIRLDLAYRQAGGEGAPIFEAYAAQLEAAGVCLLADALALGRHAATVIHECGEAGAAIVTAAQPGSGPADRDAAVREIEQAIAALHRSRAMLSGSHSAANPAEAAESPAGLARTAASRTTSPAMSTGPPRGS